MKALVYRGPGQKEWIEVEKPTLQKPTDVIVKILKQRFVEQIYTF